jgi:hypothetical protein
MKSVAVAALAIGLAAGGASAQSNAADTESKFGIGLQSAWPSYGISGLYDMSETVTLQAVIGALGTVTNFGGRAMYRFQTAPKYDLFAFGTVGLWRVAGSYDESVVGAGGGAGIELDWASIFDDGEFPPLYSTIDIGFVAASWDAYAGWSGFTMGGSLHYRF